MSGERRTRAARKVETFPDEGRSKVSEVRAADSDVLACLVSDIHLSDNCPLARAEKENWQDVQFGYVRQLREVCNRLKCALVIGGDLFDKWKVSPETVNRAIKEFRGFNRVVFAIPGNHDLPYHNYRDVDKSSYGTLVSSGVISDIPPDRFKVYTPEDKGLRPLEIYGFPWGFKMKPLERKVTKYAVTLAVCHAYVWATAASMHPGVSDDDHLTVYRPTAKTYDAVLFGDNHNRFTGNAGKTSILNPGAFIRRRSDEFFQVPVYGLLHTDGRITTHEPDVSQDKWVPKIDELADVQVDPGQLEQFLEMLKDDKKDTLDFKEQLLRYMTALKVSTAVQGVILKALE